MKRLLLSLAVVLACLCAVDALAQCGPNGCPTPQAKSFNEGWRPSPVWRAPVLPQQQRQQRAVTQSPRKRYDERQIEGRQVRENRLINRQPTLAWRFTKKEGHYRSVVRVMGRTGTSDDWVGSGCAVRWGNGILILTAEHMLRGTTHMLAEGKSGYQVCKVLGRDQTWDVAILEPENPADFVGAEIAWLEDGDLKAGDRLESCGVSHNKLAVNSGILQGWGQDSRDQSRNTDWLVMSGLARQGDSGGPIFRRKKVVGILWGTSKADKTVTGVQMGRLHVFLRQSLGEKRYQANRRLLDLNLGLGCRPDRTPPTPTPSPNRPRPGVVDNQQQQPIQQPEVKAKESESSPLLMTFLAIVAGFGLGYGVLKF